MLEISMVSPEPKKGVAMLEISMVSPEPKEMKLREAIDRVLILCPAPLTIQWQDELLRWFGESFDIIFSAVDQQQLTNPWHRTGQVIASLDYAKQEDVRERVLSERWDLVIIDEAHKCSAYTRS